MILKLVYSIRFPLGGDFSLDPYFLFIKNVYASIKKILCINENKKCENCINNNKCIYYMLSGNDFDYYPSIVTNRKMIEKRRFKNNEDITLIIYMIGIAGRYDGFIQEYFNTTKYLEGQVFQKVLIEQTYIDENEYYDGNITFKTLISSKDDVIASVQYYNNVYHTNFLIPDVDIIDNNSKIMNDYNKYFVNGHLLKYSGYKYNAKVRNYSKILFKIGAGKNAIIGGGKACEN